MLLVSTSSTVLPLSGAALIASTSSPASSATVVTSRTNAWNCSFLATKSVSELTSTAAPLVPCTSMPTRPSAAVRLDFLAAAARPLVRSQSTAASMSPLASASAFLQSIMPAPLFSRSSLTIAAVISAMSFSSSFREYGCGRGRARALPRPYCSSATKSGVDLALGLGSRLGDFGLGRCVGLGDRGRLLLGLGRRGGDGLLDRRLGHRAEILPAHLRSVLAATGRGDRHGFAIEADRAARIVVRRHREGDAVGRDVRIEDRDDRDAERVGFLDRQLFLVGVDHEHHVGNAAHVADAAERQLELVALTGELKDFLLGEARGVARQALFERLEALDRLRDRLPVGQHAAEPAMVDEMLARLARGLGDRLLRLALGADEQHLAAGGDGRADELQRACEQRHGLRQIDDVDAVAIAEDVRLHLGVPAVRLVTEVSAGLEQLLHGDDGSRHNHIPFRLVLWEAVTLKGHRYVRFPCGVEAARLAQPAAQIKR